MKRAILPFVALALTGCLEPKDEEVDPRRAFGPRGLAIEDAPHVEDDPTIFTAARAAEFTTEIAYLKGFAAGDSIWYWRVNGVQTDLIAPFFVLEDADGNRVGRPIIDVIPGDGGYSPWWRLHVVRTTDAYDGELIWSREAIDAGVAEGILEPPEATRTVLDCPVTLRDLRIEVGGGAEPVAPGPVWYRGFQVHWVAFSEPFDSPRPDPDAPYPRRMAREPVYILQRLSERFQIYEFAEQIDLDGDGRLVSSNNIFAAGLDEPDYTPLWYASLVRVTDDYLSIETSTTSVGLSADDQFLSSDGRIISSNVVDVIEAREQLENCPLQRARGAL